MHNITIDFNNPGLPQVIDVMQSDSQSRFIGLTLYDGGVPYSAPSGAVYTVEYHGPGPNNTGWYDTIQLSSGTRKAVVVSSSSSNVVTLELAEQALRVNGKVEVSLCVVNNTGYKLNTFPIICRVTGAPYVDPVSVRSYFYVTGLTSEQWTAYVTACQDAQKRAEDAAAKLVIDPTLTQEGQAADAAKVGEAVTKNATDIGELKEDIDIFDSGLNIIESDIYSKKTTSYSNVTTNTPYNFLKGKKYKIIAKADNATTLQFGTIANIGDADYVNKSPILTGTPIYYELQFRASENAQYIYVYRLPIGTNVDITVEEAGDLEFATKDSVRKMQNNSVNLYDFFGKKDGVLECDAWEQGDGYITKTHSGDLFSDIVVVPKYITAYNCVIEYDFVPYQSTNISAFTKCAGFEYFWKQGYFVSVDYYTKTLNIHNKYGNDDQTLSTTIPAVKKQAKFFEDDYIGKKHRLRIERTQERGVKATLISLVNFSELAVVESDFEAETIPSVGLGYDYPCFMVSGDSKRVDLYYAGVKIKNSSRCHLYIVGDSITEGVAIEPSKAWAYMVANSCNNTVVSGRGGATINSIIPRLESEANMLKPKYIMVMIGTNSGNTMEKLNKIVDKIKELEAVPIINCVPCTSTSIQSGINSDILSLGTPHVRMDIATAVNYDLNNGADSSLFLSDGVHPNESGHARMYKQVMIDCPFLFD